MILLALVGEMGEGVGIGKGEGEREGEGEQLGVVLLHKQWKQRRNTQVMIAQGVFFTSLNSCCGSAV